MTLNQDSTLGLRTEADENASSRKEDHIDLAFKSAVADMQKDNRFYYEPMLSGHPNEGSLLDRTFLGRKLRFPLLVSSMTGGTEKARLINKNLAKVCGQFGLGMGLGSCRQLLYEDRRLDEFNIRPYMPEQVLLMNLGIAQIEELIDKKETERITELASKLDSDALIVHVNPLQEWLQPEGDVISRPPIETVETLMGLIDMPVVVKEVGQGFGKESLRRLLKLPLAAIDLAGFGGTNFSKLELLRSDEVKYESFAPVFTLGHSCNEMIDLVNGFFDDEGEDQRCHNIIISGGIKNFLDGYYLMKKSKVPAMYAQASAFLKHAMDYDELEKFVRYQTEGLKMANAFLSLKQ